MTVDEYLRDGAEIYRRSFATIRAEADLAGVPPDLEPAAVRMIHACGMVDLVADLAWSPGVGRSPPARRLRAGAPILTDSMMLANGDHPPPPAGRQRVVCTLARPRRRRRTRVATGTTRSAAAVDRWLDRLDGAVVAIGNAPTALFRLLELLDAGAPRPAAVIGVPVGFVGAAESKVALAQPRRRRRGSPCTAGAAAARSRPPPSTRWRASARMTPGLRPLLRRRGRPRRPRAASR